MEPWHQTSRKMLKTPGYFHRNGLTLQTQGDPLSSTFLYIIIIFLAYYIYASEQISNPSLQTLPIKTLTNMKISVN